MFMHVNKWEHFYKPIQMLLQWPAGGVSTLASGVILGCPGTDTQRPLITSQTAPRHHLLLQACGHVVRAVF